MKVPEMSVVFKSEKSQAQYWLMKKIFPINFF